MSYDMINNINIGTSKRLTLLIIAMASFITTFMATSITIALPSIAEELLLDAILVTWVTTSFLLVAAMFLLPFGRLADIYGRKKIYIYGILVYTAASLLCAISSSAILLILFRVLQGIGSAMIFGTGAAILTSVFSSEERGRALGINAAAIYLGLSLGPFLGGLFTQHLGWRSIFFMNLPLGVVVLTLVLWKLKGEWSGASGKRFDIVGSIIYGLSLVVMMFGFSLLPTVSGIILVSSGLLGILAFIWWEMQTTSPILNMNLFRNNAVFAFSNLASLIRYSGSFAVVFLLSLYLQYTKGLNPQNAGLILVAQPVIMTICSPFAGRLSDRIEPRIVATIGMTLTFIGLFLFVFLNEETSLAFIITSLIILGCGSALFSSPNTNAVMSSVDKGSYGIASAMLGTMRLTGQMLSMSIVMIVFAVYMGRVVITPDYYPSFLISTKVAFVIFAALTFIGIFASLARGKVR
ncbi:MFS transporter [Chloroflexota bacterium]